MTTTPSPSRAPQALAVSEREQFEAYITKDCGDLTTFGYGANMHYLNGYVNNAWLGWQARAALAPPAPVERVGLTEERVNDIWDRHVGNPTARYPLGKDDFVNFARAIERAHGITKLATLAAQPAAPHGVSFCSGHSPVIEYQTPGPLQWDDTKPAAPASDRLISHTETVSEPGAALKVNVLHLTDAGRACLTSNVKSIPAAPAAVAVQQEATRDLELAMMIRQLVSALRKARPCSPQDLDYRAINLLRKHDLLGSPLRGNDESDAAHPASQARSPLTDEVAAFLWGEAPLDGVWFGENHPTIKGHFWWRKFITRGGIGGTQAAEGESNE